LIILFIILVIYGKYKSEIKNILAQFKKNPKSKKYIYLFLSFIIIISFSIYFIKNQQIWNNLHGELQVVTEIEYSNNLTLMFPFKIDRELKHRRTTKYIYDAEWNLLRKVNYNDKNKKISQIDYIYVNNETNKEITYPKSKKMQKELGFIDLYGSSNSLNRNTNPFIETNLFGKIFVYDSNDYPKKDELYTYNTSTSTIRFIGIPYETYGKGLYREKIINYDTFGRPLQKKFIDKRSPYAGIARVNEKTIYKYYENSFEVSVYDTRTSRDQWDLIKIFKVSQEIKNIK
jgi:hypothetical protein